MTLCKRCYVSGRVQGVYFRGATRNQATALGLTGRAANLADGRVMVEMCGDAAAVESLCHWLWKGPQHARVDNVVCETVQDIETRHSFNSE